MSNKPLQASNSPFEIVILNLFPQQMGDFFLKGIFKKAHDAGLFKIRFIQLRDFARDRFSRVDESPFGHRQGMLLKAEVILDAISSIENYRDYRLLYTCPKGQVLTQGTVSAYLHPPTRGIILLCGYYEGVDERVFSLVPFERVSIGDVVLSSGELPALVVAEAIVRQLPGVLGNPESLADDSIISGVLEFPQYTAPRVFRDLAVPEVLLSGHHGQIATWKRKESLRQTLFKKPHLLVHSPLREGDSELLVEIMKEESNV